MKRATTAVVVSGILGVGFAVGIVVSRPVPATDQSNPAAGAAVEALAAAATRFQAGLRLIDYPPILAEVLRAEERFQLSDESQRLPEIARLFAEARAHHEWVGHVWPMKLTRGGVAAQREIPTDMDALRFFGPDMESSLARAELLRSKRFEIDGEEYVDSLVSCVLTRAAELSREAELLLMTPDSARAPRAPTSDSTTRIERDRRQTRLNASISALRGMKRSIDLPCINDETKLTLQSDGTWLVQLVLPRDWRERSLTPEVLRNAASAVRRRIAETDSVQESAIHIKLVTPTGSIVLESEPSAPLGFLVEEFWID